MPDMPEGWKQINFRAPSAWRLAASALQAKTKAAGELISLEEAYRRLYRSGAEREDVWSATQETPRP